MRLPRTIAGYEFVELLGVGGFGSVYRAILRGDLGFEQGVAIKVLDASRARIKPDLVLALVNEASILSGVQHPNVVQARHFVRISDEVLGETWMLVMELVRGQTLRRMLHHDAKSPTPLPITAPLQILSELSDGLHFAHRVTDEHGRPVGLVHRDLKPENVVVSNEGRIKILDFGIAYAKRRGGTGSDDGRIVGTPSYMSPEQLRGAPVDRRSDLYALGTICFEMFAGAPFVVAPNDAGAALIVARGVRFEDRESLLREGLERRYPDDSTPELRDEIVGLVGDLLQHDRELRPSKAGEVFDRLEAMSAHRPSVGRGHLRRRVAKLNDMDRDAGVERPDGGLVQRTKPLIRPEAPTMVEGQDTPDEFTFSASATAVLSGFVEPPPPRSERIWKGAALALAALLALSLLAQLLT
jgi:serine/threonine protein kinase